MALRLPWTLAILRAPYSTGTSLTTAWVAAVATVSRVMGSTAGIKEVTEASRAMVNTARIREITEGSKVMTNTARIMAGAIRAATGSTANIEVSPKIPTN